MPAPRLRLLVACAIVACVLPLRASSAKFFLAATQTEFLKGDVDNLSVDSRGELALGPATEVVYEAAAPFLWAVEGQADGTLYAGTGNEGQVFKIDPAGKASIFYDSPELEVHALAPAPNGGLFVGTSPDGRIYQVDRNGNGKPFFSSDDKYIWALVVDGRGSLFAATGDKGIVYRITPDGKGVPFYKTNATHATALALDRAGNLLVGTSSPGRVLRVTPDGKGFVLLDSPFQEIRSLRFDDKGALYVAALNGRASTGAAATTTDADRTPTDSARAPVASVSAEITSVSIVDVGSGPTQSAPREDRRSVKGAVYRIQPDGVWDQLWESREDSPYDLAFDQSGALLVGTGNKGKLYRFEGEPLRPTLLTRAGAQQITAFYKDSRGRLLYATANPGKLFRLAAGRATRGTYESESRDAQMVATWGALSWHGTTPAGSRIELFTRSGNTETPDDTWSAWSAPYQKAEGSQITSPKARYLQWRAVLTGQAGGPILTSVTAAYLQRNIRPQVRSITVHPPGIVFQKPFSTGDPELAGFEDQSTPDRKLAAQAAAQSSGASAPALALGRRTYQKGLQTIVWRADDENEDELVYDVLYRREGETSWKTLRKGMQEAILVWDTNTVPNGTYFIRIVASDAPANAAAEALAGEMDSTAFDIDNTPPSITIGAIRVERGRTIVTFDVTDDHSPIQRVEFSQDGQHWRSLFPVDGIADSRSERYELSIDGELGERGVTLRASDSMNNVSTAQVEGRRRP
jgi:outer membrane protein assembly factor BamB